MLTLVGGDADVVEDDDDMMHASGGKNLKHPCESEH